MVNSEKVDWQHLEKRTLDALERMGIKYNEVENILEPFSKEESIIRLLFSVHRFEALKPFYSGLSKFINIKQLDQIIKWCEELSVYMSGGTISPTEFNNDNSFNCKVAQREEQRRYIETMTPTNLKKEDLFRTVHTLSTLKQFREKLLNEVSETRLLSRKLETKLLSQPSVTKLLHKLTVYIDKQINSNHMGKYRGNEQKVRILDKSYQLASLITQIYFRLQKPIPIATVRSRIQHLISPETK